MIDISEVFAILFGLAALFLVLFVVFKWLDLLFSYGKSQTANHFGPYLMLKRIRKKYLIAIEDNMPFYEKLDDKDKVRFEKRVQRFIDIKKFIPRGEIEVVSPEMKALIAGTAIKLTFGFPYVYMSHFWQILIYHDNYYSEITKKYHKGEVHTKGHIVLSWNNFIHGHENRTDGVNLGLHEYGTCFKN